PEARLWEEALRSWVAPRTSWVAEVAGAARGPPPALRSCLPRQLGGQEAGQPWGQEAGQPWAARVEMAVQPRPVFGPAWAAQAAAAVTYRLSLPRPALPPCSHPRAGTAFRAAPWSCRFDRSHRPEQVFAGRNQCVTGEAPIAVHVGEGIADRLVVDI